jgi:Domain of Unknown Function (DUF1080)
MHRFAAVSLLGLASFGAESGFKDLFNGKDLSGWTLVNGSGRGYVVENGVLVCPADGGGNLLTEKDYANFVLRFEFKLSPGGNNGVGIRAPLQGDIAYSGMEIQILDHNHPKYKDIQPWQRHGSVYNVAPAKAEALKPAGEWNQEEIVADGKKIKVTLNGVVITEADLSTVTDEAVIKKHPGILRTTGRLGFLGHGTLVEFRNIRVRELK